MKTSYQKTLYVEFNDKVDSIFKYSGILQDETNDTTRTIQEYLTLYETFHDVLTKAKAPPIANTQFAIEQRPGSGQLDGSEPSLKEVAGKIKEQAPLLQHKFEHLLRTLQFQTQLYQDYQNLTNTISEEWDRLISEDQGV